MKKLLTIALLSTGLTLALSSCKSKSDYEKYWEIQKNASNSPITELDTPDGFRFDMSEDKWNKAISQFNLKEYGYETYYEWQFDNSKYSVEIDEVRFHEGKLCYYEIWINRKIYNGKPLFLNSNDIKNIISYYEDKIGDESDYLCSSEIYYSFKTYVWAKNNMIFELLCPTQPNNPVMVKCMNQPVWDLIVEENKKESNFSSPTPTTTNSVIVKNNKWNGGVKQVEDYLEQTLRDPDSYESIEWSEVKRKEDGFYVRHKYRAKNGFGGYVVANQLFHLDFSGNVIEVKDLY